MTMISLQTSLWFQLISTFHQQGSQILQRFLMTNTYFRNLTSVFHRFFAQIGDHEEKRRFCLERLRRDNCKTISEIFLCLLNHKFASAFPDKIQRKQPFQCHFYQESSNISYDNSDANQKSQGYFGSLIIMQKQLTRL